jgi:ribosome biogenesis protein NSA2
LLYTKPHPSSCAHTSIFVLSRHLTPASLDHDERKRKRAAREGHEASKRAQNFRGLRAKLYAEKRRKEKIQMRKTIKAHEERNLKTSEPAEPSTEALPQYLLDRSNEKNAKALSSAIKQKRNEKAARFSVPIPKVKGSRCFPGIKMD